MRRNPELYFVTLRILADIFRLLVDQDFRLFVRVGVPPPHGSVVVQYIDYINTW